MRLYLLGRQLMKVAEASFGAAGAKAPPLGLMLVLEDVVTHPHSSISEITARTGFPQSHVSTTVARFRERGLVETVADPNDGRRTLVRATPSYVRAAGRRGTASVDEAVAAALDDPGPAVVAEVTAMLDALADRFVPDARGQIVRLAESQDASMRPTRSRNVKSPKET